MFYARSRLASRDFKSSREMINTSIDHEQIVPDTKDFKDIHTRRNPFNFFEKPSFFKYIQKHLDSTSQALLHILVAALLLIMPMIPPGLETASGEFMK